MYRVFGTIIWVHAISVLSSRKEANEMDLLGELLK